MDRVEWHLLDPWLALPFFILIAAYWCAGSHTMLEEYQDVVRIIAAALSAVFLILCWKWYHWAERPPRDAALERFAWELRIREKMLVELLGTPLGAQDYLLAIRVWHMRRLIKNFWIWATVVAAISPIITARGTPVFFAVIAYFGAQSLIMAAGYRETAIATNAKLLRRMRARLTETHEWDLEGRDPAASDTLLGCLGCLELIIALTMVGNFLLALGWGKLSDLWVIGMLYGIGGIFLGSIQEWRKLELRSSERSRLRRAGIQHMEVILERLRDDNIAGRRAISAREHSDRYQA